MKKTLLVSLLASVAAFAPTHMQAQNEHKTAGLYAGTLSAKSKTTGGEIIYGELYSNNFNDYESPFIGWGNNSSRGCNEGYYYMENPSVVANPWDVQTAYEYSFKEGQKYTFKFKAKADEPYTLHSGLQDSNNGYAGRGDLPAFELTTEWADYEGEVVCTGGNANRFLFNQGDFAGTIYLDDFVLIGPTGESLPKETTYYYTGVGDLYNSDFSNGQPIIGWGNNSSQTVQDEVLVLTNPSASANPWDAQAAIDMNFMDGETYTLSFKAKATDATTLGIGFQQKDGYQGRGEFPSMDLTTEWQDYNATCTVTGGLANRFLFSFGTFAGSIYIDDLKITGKQATETTPITAEITQPDVDVISITLKDVTLGNDENAVVLGSMTFPEIEPVKVDDAIDEVTGEQLAPYYVILFDDRCEFEDSTLPCTVDGTLQNGILKLQITLTDEDNQIEYYINYTGYDDLALGVKNPVVSSSKEKNGLMYDLSGRTINRPNKGFYIQNGKKYMVR